MDHIGRKETTDIMALSRRKALRGTGLLVRFELQHDGTGVAADDIRSGDSQCSHRHDTEAARRQHLGRSECAGCVRCCATECPVHAWQLADEALERLAEARQIALRYSTAVNTGEGTRVDLFKVLVDTRIRITAAAAALDALRDFGLAEVDL